MNVDTKLCRPRQVAGSSLAPLRVRKQCRAFTLLEVLLVITTIVILAALLLPTLSKAQQRGKRIKCLNNLKQIGLAFHTFAHDHNDRFPMQVSTNTGGTMEFVSAAERLGGSFFFAFRHFQAVSNELVDPRLLICPADYRVPAQSFATLQNENVSYFVAPGAQPGHSDSIVAGDRNISGTWSSAGSALQIGKDSAPGWTHELHDGQGNILFGDSRVELLNGQTLLAALNVSKAPIQVYLPSLGGGARSGASGAVTGGSRQGATPGPATSSPGGSPGGGAASGPSAGALSQLEQLFGAAGDKPPTSTPAPKSGPVMAKTPTSETVPTLPPPAMEDSIAATKPSNPPISTNASAVAVPTTSQTAGEPWPVGLGQLVTKFGSRGTWWLLLLILAILVTVEVQRRRRARKKPGN